MPNQFSILAANICFGPGAAERLVGGDCPDCGQKNAKMTLSSDIEVREFKISGLCGPCQRKVFAPDS